MNISLSFWHTTINLNLKQRKNEANGNLKKYLELMIEMGMQLTQQSFFFSFPNYNVYQVPPCQPKGSLQTLGPPSLQINEGQLGKNTIANKRLQRFLTFFHFLSKM
jgi:hypothetical protein